jgi:hypothetical protein
MEHIPSNQIQIRNLIILFALSLIVAGALAVWMVYTGPTGQYAAKNVLLSPKVIKELHAKASNVFIDTIELSFFDEKNKTWQKKQISLDTYAKFYELVYSDKSLAKIDGLDETVFQLPHLTNLTLSFQADSNDKKKGRMAAFQQVQFSNKQDLYRVELHENSVNMRWAYFSHPGIKEKTIALFNEDIK